MSIEETEELVMNGQPALLGHYRNQVWNWPIPLFVVTDEVILMFWA